MATLLAIAGSPTYPSRTQSLLEYALAQFPTDQVQTKFLSIREIPPEVLTQGKFDSSSLDLPKQWIEEADGLIIATPIYKAAYTGVLKAFLDLLPQKSLTNKVVWPIATAGTLAHLLAIDYALKPVLSELGAQRFISTVYAIDQQIQKHEDGKISLDENLELRLQSAIQEFTQVLTQGQARTIPVTPGI